MSAGLTFLRWKGAWVAIALKERWLNWMYGAPEHPPPERRRSKIPELDSIPEQRQVDKFHKRPSRVMGTKKTASYLLLCAFILLWLPRLYRIFGRLFVYTTGLAFLAQFSVEVLFNLVLGVTNCCIDTTEADITCHSGKYDYVPDRLEQFYYEYDVVPDFIENFYQTHDLVPDFLENFYQSHDFVPDFLEDLYREQGLVPDVIEQFFQQLYRRMVLLV